MLNMKESQLESEFLYHYTSMDALCSMLSEYRKNSSTGNLTFWASSIFTMNDPREMSYGAEVLEILLPAIEKLFGLPPENSLDIKNLDREKVLKDTTTTPFVLSFTANENELGMWNLYGDNGCGISLILSKDVKSIPLEGGNSSGLVKVNYNKGIDNYPNLANIFNNGIIEWRNHNDPAKIMECKERTLSNLFTQLCPYIKSEAYKNENEYRICFANVPYKSVKFRTKNKSIIPYIEVPLPIKYLKGIQLGPCCNYKMVEQSLRFLLDTCGLNIDILSSDIPYRNI